MKKLRISILILLSLAFTLAAGAANSKSKRNVNDSDTVPVRGNVHPNARPEFDQGPTDQSLRYEKMVLVLQPTRSAKDSPETLVAQLHDPSSPLYHQWLTPEQYGKRFGISDDDLADVTAWLSRKGFIIDEVGAGRGWINFSGTVGDVERAFKTQIHDYKVNGKLYHANNKDPEIPRALTDIVGGVVTLHNFGRVPMNHGFTPVPEYTSGTSHYLAPQDFATIYNVNTLYSAGINGTGQTVAIVGRTDIKLADVQYFRSFFGLPANDPVFVHNGTTPGNPRRR
jgi:subtilase family serine protease